MEIKQATILNAEEIAPLFDAYRQFYKQPSDLTGANKYIQTRLSRQDSVIFFACEDKACVGFVQLYPTFSSIGMGKALILNDLYVEPAHRKKGVGENLLQAAKDYAARDGAKSLSLSTAIDNKAAQTLYERNGYEKDEQFLHYELKMH
ncbi:GNAT family N-acetyltransferase [Shouchella patagoniensis]|uniref:GNAT family N-acetyltransferase n=1 Tax=Shouchella patagoniensis TaxID=228576 RepID=UPI000994AD9E|nr:GNAT family N-acetyltransferase [Shouchella patagoniensis]